MDLHNILGLSEEQIELGQRYAYFVFKSRPARYGEIFKDRYVVADGLRRRDINLEGISLAKIIEHPQMRKIADYLCSQEEDFLDYSYA